MSASPNRFCPQCGTPFAPYASVCSTCGRNIAEPSSLPPTQLAAPPSPITGYPEYSTPPDQSPPTPPSWASPSQSNPYLGYSMPGQPPLVPPSGTPSPYAAAGQNSAFPPPYGVPPGLSYAAPSQQSAMGVATRRRPVGVTLLAVLVGLQALDTLLTFLVNLLIGGRLATVVLGAIVMILAFAVVWGLWTMRRWVLWVTIVVEIFYVLIGLAGLTQPNSPASLIERVLIGLVIPAVVLICLFAIRNVRTAIRGR